MEEKAYSCKGAGMGLQRWGGGHLPFFVAVVEDLLTLEKEKLRYRILRKKDSPEESRANGAP